MSEHSPNTRTFNVSLLLVLHLALVLPLSYFLNIWADEGSTLYATQHGFWNAFQTAAAEQKQAPLYFWVLSLWRHINDSIFFARLFSIICSLAAIKLFAGLAARLFSPFAALLVTAFFALHPFLIWASLEIRVYSLVILLTIVLIRLFFTAFMDDPPPVENRGFKYSKTWFLFAATIALYTNYYLGFLLVALFAVLLFVGKWREALIYLALMAVAGVAFFPLVLELRTEFLAKTGGFQEERFVFEGLRHMWHHFLTFVLPTEIFPGEPQPVFSVVRLWIVRLAVVAVTFLAIKNRGQISKNALIFGAITAIIGLFLMAAYFLLGGPYVAIRHASVLFVPLILFITSLIADLYSKSNERTVKIGAFAVGLLVLISFSYSLTTLYPNMTKRGDWARVGEFIRQNESPGQPIIIFTAFEALALPYHYTGVNQILPDEKFFTFAAEAPFGSANSLVQETQFIISEIPPDAQMVWLVMNEKCVKTEACTPLENYVRANYTIEIEKEFYLEKLYLLKRKPQ